MKRKVKLLSAVYLLYLLLNILSGALDGVWSDLAFALSFVLPTFLALAYIKREEGGDIRNYLTLDREGIKSSLIFLAPTLLMTAGVSYTTALVLKFLAGDFPVPSVPDDFVLAIFASALLPSLIEEIMFRYLPMRALKGVPRGRVIMLSAIFFAFAHASLYQIPYALFAGFAFMLLDLIAGSILPSLILHFLNNLFSLVLIFFGDNLAVKISVNVIGSLLLVLSLVLFVKERKKLLDKIKEVFTPEEHETVLLEPLPFIIPALIVALGEILI